MSRAFILRGFHILAQIYSVLAPHLMSDVSIIPKKISESQLAAGYQFVVLEESHISEYYDQFRNSNPWFICGFILVKEENYN